ncbi:MAG: hypothetical protein HUN04_08725 [Desulfobacter sp.]|nr:MAG: hypothetical protein HUN04_08725 [Desulfobacter sp.]
MTDFWQYFYPESGNDEKKDGGFACRYGFLAHVRGFAFWRIGGRGICFALDMGQ